MRSHFANAIYGVLDYAVYPVGMLAVAPLIFRHLGAAQYGIWIIAMTALTLGSILGSGFGDANIQQIATHRGTNDFPSIVQCARGMIGIHLVTGTVMPIALWCLAPVLARHVTPNNFAMQYDCETALHFTCLAMWARIIETVPISTQRAFERYGAAVRVSLGGKAVTLLAVAVLALRTHRVAILMAAIGMITCLFSVIQIRGMQRLLGLKRITPTLDPATLRTLLACGAFTWLQAAAAVVFGQTDRLILGISMGAVALAGYGISIQIAQTIYGITASGLHFVFPLIAKKRMQATQSQLRRVIVRALLVNAALVATLSTALLFAGPHIVKFVAGTQIAASVRALFPTLIWSSALLSFSMTANYSLLALGRVQTVTWLTIGSGIAMLLAMRLLLRDGVTGIAMARLLYGASTLLLYVPLARTLVAPTENRPLLQPLSEEA